MSRLCVYRRLWYECVFQACQCNYFRERRYFNALLPYTGNVCIEMIRTPAQSILFCWRVMSDFVVSGKALRVIEFNSLSISPARDNSRESDYYIIGYDYSVTRDSWSPSLWWHESANSSAHLFQNINVNYAPFVSR